MLALGHGHVLAKVPPARFSWIWNGSPVFKLGSEELLGGQRLSVNAEPLLGLQIRQQEIAARRAVAKNPVKMDAIKREVAMAKVKQVRQPRIKCPGDAQRLYCLCLPLSTVVLGFAILSSCLFAAHEATSDRTGALCLSYSGGSIFTCY